MNKEEYKAYIEKNLIGLTWAQKIHSINRMYEKVRIVHNSKESLPKEEKETFLRDWFQPRHDAICEIRAQLLQEIQSFSEIEISNLLAEGILISIIEPITEKVFYQDNKQVLRTTEAEVEIPIEG